MRRAAKPGCRRGDAKSHAAETSLLLVLIFIFVQFAVVALAFSFGGRYERYAGFVVLAGTIAAQLAQKAFTGTAWDVAAIAVNVGMFAGAYWLYRRHRAPWTAALALVEAASIPIDGIRDFRLGQPDPEVLHGLWWAGSILAYLQLAVLIYAVLIRNFGPPYPTPASPSVDRSGA